MHCTLRKDRRSRWERRATGGLLVLAALLIGAAPASADYGAVIGATPGLVAHWPLDEPAGATTISDAQGGFTGTSSTSSPHAASLGRPALVPNSGGTALRPGNFSTPFSTALNPGSFSIEMWVRDDGSSSYTDLVTSYGGARGFRVRLTPESGGASALRMYIGDGTNVPMTTAAVGLTIGEPTHVIFTVSGGLVRTYKNGVAGSTGSRAYAPVDAANPSPFRIGNTGGANAVVDDISLYDRELTAAEATQHSNAGRQVAFTRGTGTVRSGTATMAFRSATAQTYECQIDGIVNWTACGSDSPSVSGTWTYGPLPEGTRTVRVRSTGDPSVTDTASIVVDVPEGPIVSGRAFLSNWAPGATGVSTTLRFAPTSERVLLGRIRAELCDAPTGTCVAPAGLDLGTPQAIDGMADDAAWALDTSATRPNRAEYVSATGSPAVDWDDASGAPIDADEVVLRFTGGTTPSAGGRVYARISTSAPGSGAPVDAGVIPIDVRAGDLFVDGTALPGGDGTAGQPFATISQALTVATPGQTVDVRGDSVYEESGDGAAWRRPGITIRGSGPELPEIRTAGSPSAARFVLAGAGPAGPNPSGLTFRAVRFPRGLGISKFSNDIAVTQSEVTTSGVVTGGPGAERSGFPCITLEQRAYSIEITDNYLHDCSQGAAASNTVRNQGEFREPGQTDAQLSAYGPIDGITLRGNLMQRLQQDGVQMVWVRDVLFQRNVVRDAYDSRTDFTLGATCSFGGTPARCHSDGVQFQDPSQCTTQANADALQLLYPAGTFSVCSGIGVAGTHKIRNVVVTDSFFHHIFNQGAIIVGASDVRYQNNVVHDYHWPDLAGRGGNALHLGAIHGLVVADNTIVREVGPQGVGVGIALTGVTGLTSATADTTRALVRDNLLDNATYLDSRHTLLVETNHAEADARCAYNKSEKVYPCVSGFVDYGVADLRLTTSAFGAGKSRLANVAGLVQTQGSPAVAGTVSTTPPPFYVDGQDLNARDITGLRRSTSPSMGAYETR